MSTVRNEFFAGVATAACGLVLLYLNFHQKLYGLPTFIGLPFLIGILAACWGRYFGFTQHRQAAAAALWSCLLIAAALVAFAWEGLVCIAMAVPLALPLILLGAHLGHFVLRREQKRLRPATSALLILPWITVVPTAAPPVRHVTTSLEIAAPPETVWKNVIQFPALPDPTEWYFRAGIAYPTRARIMGTGPGAIRYCQFSTGPFVEPITVWQEPRLLRFRVTSNPEPMRELSPYDIHPAHLHGYFASRQGQFELTPLSGGRTLLTGTTWYSQDLWPQMYWTLWSDAIVHRIHRRVLNHIRALAERQAAGTR